jgi:putative ABC transport system permease protein
MDTLLQDVRYAIRTLARSRGFAFTAILTLALGIGATTAIYSIVDAVMLRPLPFPSPERVVVPHAMNLKTGDQWSVTYLDFIDWRDAKVFEHVAVWQPSESDIAGDGDPQRVTSAVVSEQFFGALGVAPALGRVLQPADNALDRERVIVISNALWGGRFGSDSGVIGRKIRLGGLERTIVGILPQGAEWPVGTEVWAPMKIANPTASDLVDPDNFIFQGIARLAPGESISATRAKMAVMAKRIEAANPAIREGISQTVITATEDLLGPTLPRILWILLGAVGVVLLIGCVNIANLMLARGATRMREVAVRTALGASRARLVRQIFTESAVLAIAGGIVGVLLAFWSVKAVIAGAPANVPRLDNATVSIPVLAVALIISLVSAMLFGLAPALHASGVRPGQALGEGGQRLAGGKRSRRGRTTLVVVELALALMLLAGAGLLTHSLIRLTRTDPGFDTDRVLTVGVAPPGSRYGTRAVRRDFYDRVITELQALPGVEVASVASALPLGGGGFYLGRAFLAEGKTETSAEVDGQWNVVGPGYFRTLRMPVRGREFTPRDDTASTPVMIVNTRFAERMFPGENPLGKRALSSRDERVLREIVGVVDDVRYFGADDELRALVYVPYKQDSWSGMRIIIRASGDPMTLVAGARRVISGIDPDLAVASVATMDDALDTSLAAPRFTTFLLGAFAGVALLLVAVGLYGVLSYGITQRTHEIGIRMALGARAAHVRRMVVREALLMVVLGIIVGGAGVLALSRVMTSLLFETSATDPVTFAGVVLVLGAVGAVAAYLPARRATRVDPLIALRAGD